MLARRRLERRELPTCRLEQLTFNAQVKGLREGAEQVVGGRAEAGVRAAQVEQGLQHQRKET